MRSGWARGAHVEQQEELGMLRFVFHSALRELPGRWRAATHGGALPLCMDAVSANDQATRTKEFAARASW